MNSKNTINRFLWLSDIHFRASYNASFSTNQRTKIFIKSFINAIEKYLKDEDADFDYIILSGDIAFSGSQDDYTAFNNHILIPLLKVIEENQMKQLKSWLDKQDTKNQQYEHIFENENTSKNNVIIGLKAVFPKNNYQEIFEYLQRIENRSTKIMSCPGNHDIQRNEYPSEWRNVSHSIKPSKFQDRNKFLQQNEGSFKEQFKGYQSFFESNIKSIFPNSNLENNNGLYGGYVDEDIKVKFFVLNSAWYCINAQEGQSHKDNIISKIDNNTSGRNDEVEKSIDELINVLSISNEFGGLVVGQALIEDEINKIIKTNPEFPLVVIVHHPEWWWFWGELNSYAGDYNRPVKELLSKCDILLTGHEHLPINTSWKKINEEDSQKDSYHLMAGMFLEDNVDVSKNYGDNLFPHNRFSVIEFERHQTGSLDLKEIRFLFTGNQWINKKEITKSLNLSNTILCDQKQKDSIYAFLKENKNIENRLIKYFNDEYGQNLTHIEDSRRDDIVYSSFEDDIDKSKWLIIVPTKANFYTSTINNATFINIVKQKIIPLGIDSTIYVAFFCLDILAEDEEQYLNSDSITISSFTHITNILNDIRDKADTAFNRFKYHFFENMNDKNSNDKYLQEISFVNIVPPYWIIQK